jgi:hypothetical protein
MVLFSSVTSAEGPVWSWMCSGRTTTVAWGSVAAGAAAAEAASRTATKILVNMLHRRGLVEIWREGSSSRDLELDGHEV